MTRKYMEAEKKIHEKYLIDKGLPIPDIRNLGRPPKWPFAMLQKNDSVLIPYGTPLQVERKYNNMRGAIRNVRLRYNRQFKIRREEKGWRVWRTK